MINNPLVSVIIPTFNRSEIICRTIDNLFQQTYKRFEVIVVDDGSTDQTVSKLRQRYGDRVRIVSQSNAGPAVARNHGARIAHGDIIAFQDSDDLWKPTKIERQVAVLAKADESVPCCLCNAEMPVSRARSQTSFDISRISLDYDEGLWLNVTEVLATRFVLFNQSVAIRRQAFERVGGFDEALKYLEDYDLPLRLSLEGPWAFIREPLVVYSGTSIGSFSDQALKDPFTLKQCELTIFERMLSQVKDDDRYVAAGKYLRRRLKLCRRGHTELRLRQTSFWGAHILGLVLGTLGHYQDAVFRRSRRYPITFTVPLEIAGLDKNVSNARPRDCVISRDELVARRVRPRLP
jgi:glycosyltransferase involved in cell wall biosynthesis